MPFYPSNAEVVLTPDKCLLALKLQAHTGIHGSSLFSRQVVSDSATPWTAALLTSLTFSVSWSLLRLLSIELVMPYILSCTYKKHFISFPGPVRRMLLNPSSVCLSKTD